MSPNNPISDSDISDAYIYLLGRLLILRQQRADFEEGFQWNRLVHREPGNVAWPNPNLDVAYSEAWVSIDARSCLLVDVPPVGARYFTVQFLNGWGETVANINERVFPTRPHGRFAVCLEGSDPPVPDDVQRVDVPVGTMRALSRVELGADPRAAVALQRQFAFAVVGTPTPPPIAAVPAFEMRALPGVEAFDVAAGALDSERDINPGMEPLQRRVRAIAEAIADDAERRRIDRVIRTNAFAAIHDAMPHLGHGTVRNGWALPSTSGVYRADWLTRTLINYGGIWANTPEEVIYFKAFVDGAGTPLSGDRSYSMRFEKDELPMRYATHFWSVIAVDSVERHVLPNPLKRYLLNKESPLEHGPDGSLTLHFSDRKPDDAPQANWLPTPRGQGYSLTFRFYRGRGPVTTGAHFPPPLVARSDS